MSEALRLSKRCFAIMRHLSIDPDASYRELAVAAGYARSSIGTVSERLDELEADGWIRKLFHKARSIEVLRPVHGSIAGKYYRFIPAPAQPHEAELQVGPCVQNLLPHTGSIAAVEVTASNLVGVTCEHQAPTSAGDAVTHRDLSQHADSYTSNGFEVPHVQPDSRKGNHDHA